MGLRKRLAASVLAAAICCTAAPVAAAAPQPAVDALEPDSDEPIGYDLRISPPARGVAPPPVARASVPNVPLPGWSVTLDSPGVRVLSGPPRPAAGDDLPAAALGELRLLAGVITDRAADPTEQLRVSAANTTGPAAVVRFQQTLDGADVRGGEVLAVFDGDRHLVRLISTFRRDLQTANRRVLDEGQADAAARAALQAAHPSIVVIGVPRSVAAVERTGASFRHVWTVEYWTSNPAGSFRVTLDAETAAVLRLENAWETSTGSGRIFKDDWSAQVRRWSVAPLKSLDVPRGTLSSPYFEIHDTNGADVVSNSLRFLFDPLRDGGAFSQVNLYYHLEKARQRFVRTFGAPSPARVPALANYPICNAAYAHAQDGSPLFIFGDANQCVPGSLNWGWDADVIYHEYTHGVVDWRGIPLAEAPVNSYQRAMGEALADYHSANFTGVRKSV